MAHFDDIELVERLFLKSYPFSRYGPRANDPASTAVTPLRRPLAECTVAVVTTAGLSLPDQAPFDTTNKNGDSSFREFPADISPQQLEMHHRSWTFDQTGILRDRNLVMPLDRLREMSARGEIGALAPHHYSFMGSIVGPRKLIRESAPEVARRLVADSVDVALLTPVWPMCNQSVGLIQRAIEYAGITTVSISLLREITEKTQPPRALFVPYPLGHPLGEPDDIMLQTRIIRAAFALLPRTDIPILASFTP